MYPRSVMDDDSIIDKNLQRIIFSLFWIQTMFALVHSSVPSFVQCPQCNDELLFLFIDYPSVATDGIVSRCRRNGADDVRYYIAYLLQLYKSEYQ